jgi:hypothetical protein
MTTPNSGIIRTKHKADRGRFFIGYKRPFNDTRLSWEARGVLAYLFSKTDNWQLNEVDLVHNGPAGKTKIERIINELKQYGYVARQRLRHPKTGRFYWCTTIYEDASENPQNGAVGQSEPYPENQAVDYTQSEPLPDFPPTGDPPTGDPPTGEPSNGKPGYIRSNDIRSNDIRSNDIRSNEHPPQNPPSQNGHNGGGGI